MTAVGRFEEEDMAVRIERLEKEKAELQCRLEFVEELLGPTEAQRKLMQEQLLAARSAALRAKYNGTNIPLKAAGRLDEHLIWAAGLLERDAGLLQGGCLPNADGVMQDVSMLGDPKFHPYDQETGKPRWQARGGMLKMSLNEIRDRYGEDIAQDIVRCAKELDAYDPSRRVGIELPWHIAEERELQPAEVIDLLDRQLRLHVNLSIAKAGPNLRPANATRAYTRSHIDIGDGEEQPSPYAAAIPSLRRRGRRQQRHGNSSQQRTPRDVAVVSSRDVAAVSSAPVPSTGTSSGTNGTAVTTLPRLDPSSRRPALAAAAVAAPEAQQQQPPRQQRPARCSMLGLHRRMQHDHALDPSSCSGIQSSWIC